MVTNDKIIKVLNQTFDKITNQVDVDYKQSALMKNPKHIELVERYAKVLSQHYIAKFGHICTNMLATDLSDEIMAKVENRMQEITNKFPKDMDATLKSVKKYFGHAYSNECITNVTKECFLDDFNAEKQTFLDWTQNLDMTADLTKSNENDKATA